MSNLKRVDTARQVLAAFGGQFPSSQGKMIFVKPASGNDGASGLTAQKAVKTLAQAHTLATANQNDIVVLMAESNTAAGTTDYQSSTLTWSKDGVHLIGVNAGPFLGQRSRIALISTYVTAAPLMTVSANGCLFSGLEIYAGVASAVPLGGLNLTGQRNRFRNCQIAGIGDATMDIAGAYSLKLAGAAENLFEDCYVGLDTVTLGAAANSQILCSAAAVRNRFLRCIIATFTNHATNNNFLRAPTGSLDRFLEFMDCLFWNPIDSTSTNLTQAGIIASDAGGSVILRGNCGVIGATDFNSTDSGNVRVMVTPAATATNLFGLSQLVVR